MRRVFVASLITSLLALLSGDASAREWSDTSGKFKIQADLSGISGNSVQLKKSTGEITNIPLDKLSKPDQEYVKKVMSLASGAQAVLRLRCYSCHGEGGSDEGGMNFILNGARLVEKEKIVPSQPDKSPLLKRIVDGEMPPDDIKDRPTAAQIQALKDWIMEGAVTPSTEESRAFITKDAVLAAIVADLESANERDRSYYRYFTITHLYNAGFSADELQTFRLALTKLLNSLSWDRKLIALQPVDTPETVFRIDVRDLRWTKELWEVLVLAYPYNVRYTNPAAVKAYRLSESNLPYLRADWFVANASRPPLYHSLLQLPDTLGGLQEQLKINFAQNVRQDRASRAGFTNSGISQHPRVIERHETTDGACWVSYDFAGSAGGRNFFNNPLSFEFDGSEIIFSLPNGLQAYMIVNREGNRIDKAPTNMVRDPSALDAAVTNGVSCMRCHASGIILKADEIRAHVNANSKAFGNRLKTILALYPEQDKFQEMMKEDRDRFGEALKQMGIERMSPEGEPIFNIARRLQDPVDVRLASAELGRTPDEFRKELDRTISLQRSVGPLRIPGGTLTRDAFDEAFGALVAAFGGGRFVPPIGKFASAAEAVAANDDATSEPAESSEPAGDNEGAAVVPTTSSVVGAPRRGLAHHWKFDETKGDTARDTAGRNNAVLGNYQEGEPRWVKGQVGNALQFSGAQQLAITAKGVNATQFTIAFWLQVQLEEGTNPRIVSPWIALNLESHQGIGVAGKVIEPTKPDPGEWYHYAVAIDLIKRKATIYRNGAEVASGRLEVGAENGRWVFGHNQDPGNHGDTFNGLLDDVRVYKRILSEDEVSKLYEVGAGE